MREHEGRRQGARVLRSVAVHNPAGARGFRVRTMDSSFVHYDCALGGHSAGNARSERIAGEARERRPQPGGFHRAFEHIGGGVLGGSGHQEESEAEAGMDEDGRAWWRQVRCDQVEAEGIEVEHCVRGSAVP